MQCRTPEQQAIRDAASATPSDGAENAASALQQGYDAPAAEAVKLPDFEALSAMQHDIDAVSNKLDNLSAADGVKLPDAGALSALQQDIDAVSSKLHSFPAEGVKVPDVEEASALQQSIDAVNSKLQSLSAEAVTPPDVQAAASAGSL